MDFAQQQRNPTKHIVGFTIVVLLHVLIVYALVNGLARKIVAVIKQPLETKIIEEVKPPPPPPEVLLPPPPKFVAPPPPYIPPPEVQIQPPPVVPQNVITTTTNVPPPEPPAPVAPRVVEAPPAPPAPPPSTSVAVVCPNIRVAVEEVGYPPKAQREGISSGETLVEFLVGANGETKNVAVVKSTNRLFNGAALSIVQKLKCIGQGQDIRVQAPIVFKLD
jgi:periplasmic protein TonB